MYIVVVSFNLLVEETVVPGENLSQEKVFIFQYTQYCKGRCGHMLVEFTTSCALRVL
jgi:hypothetical protein